MTKEEALRCMRQSSELKVYEFANGFVITENDEKSGYNFVVECEGGPGVTSPAKSDLIPKLGKWITEQMSYIDEKEAKGFSGIPFGYRIRAEVEPIYTDDYILLTKMEQEK